MREIKFRAWSGRRMLENVNTINGQAAINHPYNPDDKILQDEDGVHYYCNWDFDKPVDYPLMQFTGLKDVNGVDVYEGDILKEKRVLSDGVVYNNVLVIYNPPSFEVDSLPLTNYMGITWEIIGNIHENRELLGG